VPGYTMDKSDYARRLRRIEGQVRGLQRMVEDDTYCIDVLTQISAVSSALESVALGLLDQHIRHCVADAAKEGDEAETDRIVAEATSAIARLVRS
jgi:DNA-binding FrmR family transcriptional regulator